MTCAVTPRDDATALTAAGLSPYTNKPSSAFAAGVGVGVTFGDWETRDGLVLAGGRVVVIAQPVLTAEIKQSRTTRAALVAHRVAI